MVSQATQKLIQKYQLWRQSLQPREDISTMHVDELASKVAGVYEKIRGVIDWREEHLLRKSAIERNLKRRLILNQDDAEIASRLVLELIRGGYFPNDKIEESKIETIKNVIDKYVIIINNSPNPPQEKLKIQLQNWLLELASCEIEETLDPRPRESALMEYMMNEMETKIEVKDKISDEDKKIQIYIAMQRALFKLDSPIISYHLLEKKYPEWHKLSFDVLNEIAQNIYPVWEKIEEDLKHPLAQKFYRICEQYDTPYLLLGDVLSEDVPNIQERFDNPEKLEVSIKSAYEKRYNQLKARLRRAAIFSTVSIFLTKMLLALAIEIPLDKYIVAEFNLFTLVINILIPPLLMFLLVLTITPPGKSNLQKVIIEIMKIVYEGRKKDVYTIKAKIKRSSFLNGIIFFFYFITFLVSFGLIWFLLSFLPQFGIFSKIIFMIFVSLISFAGVKIRERAKELQVEPDKGNALTFLMDGFSLPFIQMGKWLSSEFAKYNIFVVFFNSLIDMPFQLFVEFLEQWRYFIREKREEIH